MGFGSYDESEQNEVEFTEEDEKKQKFNSEINKARKDGEMTYEGTAEEMFDSYMKNKEKQDE